jgi:hypothetical protein
VARGDELNEEHNGEWKGVKYEGGEGTFLPLLHPNTPASGPKTTSGVHNGISQTTTKL